MCGLGEGDCDADKVCAGSLKCGSTGSSCGDGFGSGYSCCIDDGYTPDGKTQQSICITRIPISHHIPTYILLFLFQMAQEFMFKCFSCDCIQISKYLTHFYLYRDWLH